MLAASGSFGDKSGVYRYSYNLITGLSDYLKETEPEKRIILFSFFPDLFRKLAPDLAALEERSNIIIFRKLPVHADPLFTYESVQPRVLYRACRKTNHLYMKVANKFIMQRYYARLRHDLLEHNVGLIHQSETIQRTVPGIPNVITIHDLVAVKFPQWQRDETVRIHRDKLEYTRTDVAGIIAVSNHTAQDIREYYGDVPYTGTIRTIYEAAEAIGTDTSSSWQGVVDELRDKKVSSLIKERYFIHVGTFDPRKNIDLLVEAFIKEWKSGGEFKKFKLVLIGGSGWGNVYQKVKQTLSAEFGVSDSPVLILDYVSDDVLAALLKNAYALVYPSRYEGFGLPILEAMQFGTPVIASNATSIPEVCGTACSLVEPNSIEGIAQAMRTLVDHPDKRNALVEKSLRRVQDFSWEKTAEETYEFYRSVATSATERTRPRGSFLDRHASTRIEGADAFAYLIRSLRLSVQTDLYIVGAAGYGNVGDDMMLKTLTAALRPKHVALLMDGINDNPQIISGLKKQGYTVAKNRSKLFRTRSLVLIGGGTLFNTDAYPQETYLEYAYRLLIEGFKIAFIGVEAVDFADIVKARYIFRNAEFISVRNRDTKALIQAVTDGESAPLFVTGDIISYMALPEHSSTTDMVGLCISPKTKATKGQLRQLNKRITELGKNAEFFSFCRHPFDPAENDLAIATTVADIHLFDSTDTAEVLRHISRYEAIITSRFHATLIAFRMGKKVITVSKEAKCVRFCSKMKIPRYDSLESLLATDVDQLAHHLT